MKFEKEITDAVFGGERPLFASHGLLLKRVTIEPGESALKECSDIKAVDCEFKGKYPFWHVDGFEIDSCVFREGARAALWYSRNLVMRNTLVEAPKMFREMENLELTTVRIPDAQETMWHVSGVRLRDVEVAHADYLFMHSSNIDIEDYRQQGNYSFQYCKNVVIRKAHIDSKDAFWNTENVTIYDSELTGEYLGWHSRNLRLVRCRIAGTQPLCYCHNLVMEDCEMAPDCDLAFECSSLDAKVNGRITSVKNPTTGRIIADEIGEIILDENIHQPANCIIQVKN